MRSSNYTLPPLILDSSGIGDSVPRSRSTSRAPIRPLPTLRPGADTAETYEIIPYVAAPQSTSINAFCSTPCMKWVFTGGSDGYIRKYDWFSSINGKVPLTVAQKHPFVDSVTRAGVLLSYWENEEQPVKNNLLHIPETTDDTKLSPVYSLAVHSQALWLLSGLESGGINLQTVRHDEGRIVHTLRQHSSAVSVLTLSSDEISVLSGSWDRTIADWDLNTGQPVRIYTLPAGQISSLEFRPTSTALPVATTNGTTSAPGTGAAASPAESNRSFGSLFGDDDDDGNPRSPQQSNSTISDSTLQAVPSSNGDQPPPPPTKDSQQSHQSDSIFLSTSMDGLLRIYDRRTSSQAPIFTAHPPRGCPPWCMSAVWSTDGNSIYCGRRNSTVDEFSLYNGLATPMRTLKFPLGSGPVSALCAMPNGRSLICASFDNLRLWDLKADMQEESGKKRGKLAVPFEIVPGHHGGVVSKVWVDRSCRYLLSVSGNRGWEGVTTEVWLGYTIT
ncbi:WD40 repeat-like protein [Ascodesmis nigricans]|uniref:Mitochondrial division protein 1 n=1 Tax=Ascodesmis nigricans TaxID=341454 RepID=A0A4S2N1U1_9PEZI|nr:WD40 repeat-like protein [Ascodesmis nigricans]